MNDKTLSAVTIGTRKMEIQSFDIPAVSEDDGLLKVEMCGVCGSDPHWYEDPDADFFPIIFGHELVGEVAEIGSQASARWDVEKGDRIVVEARFGCGYCRMCLIGEYRYCQEELGYGCPIKSNVPPYLWGGYGQYMYLAPNSRVHRISKEVPIEAAVMTCANIGNAIRWVRHIGEVTIGDTVVVLGPGGQGLAAVVAAHEAGAEKIIVVGLTRDEHRFEVAKLFGATHTIDAQKVDPIQMVRDLTNSMFADVVVDVTGVVKSVPLSIELVRPMGTVILASNSGPTPVSLIPDTIATKEIRYQGVFTQDAPAARAAIKLIESRRYPIEKMVTHQFSLDEAERAVRITGGEIEMEGFIKGVIVPN